VLGLTSIFFYSKGGEMTPEEFQQELAGLAAELLLFAKRLSLLAGKIPGQSLPTEDRLALREREMEAALLPLGLDSHTRNALARSYAKDILKEGDARAWSGIDVSDPSTARRELRKILSLSTRELNLIRNFGPFRQEEFRQALERYEQESTTLE